jgi:hypothetical protein
MKLVPVLKQQIMKALTQRGVVKFEEPPSDPAVRAVAELIQERRCRDEYDRGCLVLVVTRKGVE